MNLVFVAQLIALFFRRLQSPTCLVAHNGNCFDFIQLEDELESLNFRLPYRTYCVDSLGLFRSLEKDKEQKEKVNVNNIAALEEDRSETLSQMQMVNDSTQATNLSLDVVTLDQTSEITEQTKRAPRLKRKLSRTGGETSNSSSGGQVTRKKFRLCDVYERLQGVPPKISQYAECDVEALLKCAIAEGPAFVAYAEKHSVLFKDLRKK